MLFLAALFGVVLCAIGGFLAWRSYQSRVEQAQARVLTVATEAARASEQFFDDRIAVLQAVTEVPTLDGREPSVMDPVLDALASEDLGFKGGLSWVDLDGMVQASTSIPDEALPLDVSGQDFVVALLDTEEPFVGSARITEASGQTVVPVAVPTMSSSGDQTGLLVASILVDDLVREIPALAPAAVQVRVVDRSGEIILENGQLTVLEPPANFDLLDPEGPRSLIGKGLRGDDNRIVGVGRVEGSGWVVVAEQNRVSALSGARSRLIGELGVLAAFTLVTMGAALMAAQRLDESHREMIRGARDLGAMEVLSETLAVAPDTRQVAASAVEVFGQVFESDAVVVGLADPMRGEMRVRVDGSSSGLSEYTISLDSASVLTDAYHSDRPLILSAEEVAAAYPEVEAPEAAQRTGVVAVRFKGQRASGAVGLYLGDGFPPSRTDLELLEAMVPMLGDSFGRALAAERERDASRIFQEALLPQDSLGIEVPLQRAVRYQAALGDVEVGGDWYDLWMIDDRRVGMVVGDVVGRGVVAAAAMGQLRSAVRATVGAAASPADALHHVDAMTRQITGSPGATVVLGILDLRTGAVRLASAGHLPPLLAKVEGVRVLDGMIGTPIGFFAAEGAREGMTVKLGPEDTLVLYSDGLVERRDENIDDGIARLAKVLEEHRELPVEGLADTLLDLVPAPGNPDDVALVCVRPIAQPARHFTGVVPLAQLGGLEDAMSAWLEATGLANGSDALGAVDATVGVVRDLAEADEAGDVMVEVDPTDSGLVVTIEYRHRPGAVTPGLERRILRGWGSGEMTPRGPRTRLVL